MGKKAQSPVPEAPTEDTKAEEPAGEQSDGEFVFPDGSTYAGQYLRKGEDVCLHGEGILKTGPETFKGQFENGLYKFGTYTSCSGSVYVGNFNQNVFHGKGEYTWPDGRTYSGTWQDGSMHGRGTFLNFSIGADKVVEQKITSWRELVPNKTRVRITASNDDLCGEAKECDRTWDQRMHHMCKQVYTVVENDPPNCYIVYDALCCDRGVPAGRVSVPYKGLSLLCDGEAFTGFCLRGRFESGLKEQADARRVFLEEYGAEVILSARAALKEITGSADGPPKEYLVPAVTTTAAEASEAEAEQAFERAAFEELVKGPFPEAGAALPAPALQALGARAVEGAERPVQVVIFEGIGDTATAPARGFDPAARLKNQQLQYVGQAVEFWAPDAAAGEISSLVLVNASRDYVVTSAKWKLVHCELVAA